MTPRDRFEKGLTALVNDLIQETGFSIKEVTISPRYVYTGMGERRTEIEDFWLGIKYE